MFYGGTNIILFELYTKILVKVNIPGFNILSPWIVTGKLVQCVYGNLLLAVVDMRKESETYLQYDLITISDKNRTQVLVPPGFANGHLVMSEFGIFSYKQSTLYGGQASQFTVKWDDPLIDIPWPVKNPILSSRDSEAKYL